MARHGGPLLGKLVPLVFVEAALLERALPEAKKVVGTPTAPVEKPRIPSCNIDAPIEQISGGRGVVSSGDAHLGCVFVLEPVGIVRRRVTTAQRNQEEQDQESKTHSHKSDCEKLGKILAADELCHGMSRLQSWRMVHDDTKLALDTRRLDVYLTSVQAEVEAKVRLVHRFREHMQQLDGGPSGRRNPDQRKHAARAMISQVDGMLQTNLLVRDMLEELREAAQAVLSDLTAGD